MSVDRSEGSQGLFICLGREWLNPECIEAVTFVAEEGGASPPSCKVAFASGESRDFYGDDARALKAFLADHRAK